MRPAWLLQTQIEEPSKCMNDGKRSIKMSEDLIRRGDAIKAIKDNSYAGDDDYIEINGYGAIEDIKALPSADRPQGYWFYSWSIFSRGYECTNCHKKAIEEYDFCPNCGARMKGADDGADND